MANPKKKTFEFYVSGMECKSCEKIIERKLKKSYKNISVKSDYYNGTCTIKYIGRKPSVNKLFLSLEDSGYFCEQERSISENTGNKLMIKKSSIKNVFVIFGLLLLVIGGYSLIEEYISGVMPVIGTDTSIMVILILGFFTGFHCIAMCGGFVLSYSTKKGNSRWAPHLTYGISKTVSYAIVGAVFGLIGSFFTFTPFMRGAAAVLAGLFLIGFGLNMLDMLKWFRHFRISTPNFLKKLTRKKDDGPMMLGLLNGLMIACGPLQAMYLVAASTGSPYIGALYLAVFSLGTLPVLMGFGLITSIVSKKFAFSIVRYSGVVVILLGLIMVNRGLSLSGTGYDLNTISASITPMDVSAEGGIDAIEISDDGFQTIRMEVNRYGWKPDKFVLKKGVPVKWIIDGKEINECNNAIQVPEYDLEFQVKRGEQTTEFTPDKEGTIPFSCWMGMIPGTFIVKDDININDARAIEKELEKVDVPKGGSCGGSCGSPSCGGGGGCGCGGR